MPRLSLRSKLLAGFLLVLLPVLALILLEYNHDYLKWSDKILDDQLRTSQAVSALVDASIDDAFAVAWSLSRDPILQTMDPRQADPHLASRRESLPQFEEIAILDLDGNAVGLMSTSIPPGVPRPGAADRAHFQEVKSSGQPAVSNVLFGRATGKPTLMAAVPMLDATGGLRGVAVAALDLEYLAQRLQVVKLYKSQAIFLTDSEGTAALHTLLPHEDWGRRSLSSLSPVRSALNGVPALERNILGILGDARMISTTRTEKYGWVVGVSIPTAEALQPVQDHLIGQLILYAGALVFAGLVALFSARYMLFGPLRVLSDALVAFGKGQLHARVRLRTGDEFEKLASGFDWMAQEISLRDSQRDAYIAELNEVQAGLRSLAFIVESSDDLIIGSSVDGIITSWNPAAERICGYCSQEVIGQAISLLTPRDRLDEMLQILERIKRGEQVKHYETVWVRKNGDFVDLSVAVSPIRDANGKIVGASSIGRDITERKQTEQSFRTLAESSPIGTYIVQQGKFRFVNTRFQGYTGYTRDELLGTDALRLVLPEDREAVWANAMQMLKGKRHAPYEYRITNKAGDIRWIMETVASIQYEGKRTVVGNFMDITDRRQMEQQLAHLATHDPLTGLPNRRSLEEALVRVVARARRGAKSALLFLDLDNFKEVNDTLGHAAGDRALVMVGRLIQEQLRAEDLLARLGGDEFAVLLEGATATEAEIVAGRMCRAIAESLLTLEDVAFSLGLSIGIAEIDGQFTNSMLLSHADAAMYDAKGQGGSRVVVHQ